MRKALSKTFSVLAGATLLSVGGMTIWYILGNLENPLPAVLFAEFGVFAPVIRWPFGLAVYMAIGTLLVLAFTAAARIVLVGWSQFIDEEREKSARERMAAVRQVGTLMAVAIESGGFLDSATSMIETTDGSYRVFGKVGIATKDETVTIRKDSRGFYCFEMLCVAGKEYQLTK